MHKFTWENQKIRKKSFDIICSINTKACVIVLHPACRRSFTIAAVKLLSKRGEKLYRELKLNALESEFKMVFYVYHFLVIGKFFKLWAWRATSLDTYPFMENVKLNKSFKSVRVRKMLREKGSRRNSWFHEWTIYARVSKGHTLENEKSRWR